MTVYQIQSKDGLLYILRKLSRRGYQWQDGSPLELPQTHSLMQEMKMHNYQVYLHAESYLKKVAFGYTGDAWDYAEDLPYNEEVVHVRKDWDRVSW